MTAADTVDRIFRMVDADQAAMAFFFNLGLHEGYRQGYQAAEDDMAKAWAKLAASVQASANTPSHAELQRRRAG
ncbi:MAG TPA: hypothetical protein VGP91_13155 [Actinoplanes sp.]|nr:hypothetical protein [Actinoplanes sp.]